MKTLRFAGGILLWAIICASAAVAADRTLTDDQGRSVVLRESPTPDFFHYTNERFAFTVDVSALFEKAFVVPDNGDGVILSDAGDQARFRASGGNRLDKKTIKQLFEAERKELGSAVAYAHQGKNFYILSWTQDNEIHYHKFILGPSAWCDMELTYPTARKKEFDPIVARSAKTFSFIGK